MPDLMKSFFVSYDDVLFLPPPSACDKPACACGPKCQCGEHCACTLDANCAG